MLGELKIVNGILKSHVDLTTPKKRVDLQKSTRSGLVKAEFVLRAVITS
jgi:hypothetical protein